MEEKYLEIFGILAFLLSILIKTFPKVATQFQCHGIALGKTNSEG